jgi:uncharacterized protein YbaA (DUF1428 family)
MTYIEGFIVPVPAANRGEYEKHAVEFAPLLQRVGVGRMVENWESDVPEGKLTDFRKAVDATADEKIVFSWFEYPSKAEREAANAKMMEDPQMMELSQSDMPFDAKRMIFGGFEAVVDEGSGGGNFTDGMIVPVKSGMRDQYSALAAKNAKEFIRRGATRVVETIADDIKHGKLTDYYRAVKAEEGEGVAFSFIEWPDKGTRDQAWNAIMQDESMRPQGEVPFVGSRMFWGGFEKILDTAQQPQASQGQTPVSA